MIFFYGFFVRFKTTELPNFYPMFQDVNVMIFLGFGFLQGTVAAKLANLTTNLASILVFGIHGEVLWVLGGCMAIANLAGGFIGAKMAMRHGNEFIRTVFLVVIGVLAIKLAWDTVAQWTG